MPQIVEELENTLAFQVGFVVVLALFSHAMQRIPISEPLVTFAIGAPARPKCSRRARPFAPRQQCSGATFFLLGTHGAEIHGNPSGIGETVVVKHSPNVFAVAGEGHREAGYRRLSEHSYLP